jgi:hypothetical protein
MTLPQWDSEINQPTVQQTADLAQKYGFIKEKPALNELIRPQGGGS